MKPLFNHLLCLSNIVSCSLPAGGLISGGGIMGTMIGRLPCSLVLGVEVDGVVDDSVTPFLEAGKDWELLARSGEPSPLSDEGGFFGNKFSRQGKLSKIKCYRTTDESYCGTHEKSCHNVCAKYNTRITLYHNEVTKHVCFIRRDWKSLCLEPLKYWLITKQQPRLKLYL